LSEPHNLNDFGRRFNMLHETIRRLVRRASEDPHFTAIFETTRRLPAAALS
jgi:hypothetical protein